jgi:hypothetical protein
MTGSPAGAARPPRLPTESTVFEWSVLALSFLASAGVQIFLAVSMNVTWPFPVAAAVALMAGGCAVAARWKRWRADLAGSGTCSSPPISAPAASAPRDAACPPTSPGQQTTTDAAIRQ